MTKRTNKPKAPSTASPKAPKQPVEAIKQESNTGVAKRTKASTNAPQKASTGRRGRPKKIVVEPNATEVNSPAPLQKAVDVESRTINYQSAGNAIPSKYEQFKAWLVFKLYYYTSFFKGY